MSVWSCHKEKILTPKRQSLNYMQMYFQTWCLPNRIKLARECIIHGAVASSIFKLNEQLSVK